MRTSISKGARLIVMLLSIALIGGTSAYGQVPVSISDVEATPGESLTVPVEVGPLGAEDISSFEFVLTYDESLASISASRAGLSEDDDANFEANNPNPGELRVAVASASPLEGRDVLANLEIDVAGDVQGSTDLAFSDFQFNEGTPSVELEDGTLTVAQVFVSLPDIVQRQGTEVSIDIGVSDLSNVDVQSYQFELPFDASVLSDISVVQEGTLSEGRNIQSNVSGDVLSVAVAGTEPLDANGSPLLTIQGQLSTGSSVLSFSSFQMNEGDVSVATRDGSLRAGDAVVSFPTLNASVGSSQQIPITTTDLTDLGATSFEVTFSYDASVLDVNGVSTEGTLADGTQAQVNIQNGEVSVAVAGSSPFEGEGTLLNVDADVVAPGVSPLAFESFRFNEGDPSAVTVDGSVTAVINDPPMFTSVPPDSTIAPDSTYESQVVAQDPNGDDITYSFLVAPEGAEIDSMTGDITWVPTQEQVDSTYTLSVEATDGIANIDTSFALTVQIVNEPPEITSVPEGSVAPTTTFSGTVEATDPDEDPLTYSLEGDRDDASIDESSGDFQFTPACTLQGQDVTFNVTVSDGQLSADSSFTLSVESISQEAIDVSVSQSFGDATQQDNYRLVGLPGEINLPIENTLDGESGEFNEWRAFWDDGSSSNQEGLVEFNGSSQFNFQAGRGFWVLSRSTLSASETVDPVSVSDQSCAASIDVHSGWNIISNPLAKDIPWSDVLAQNDINAELHSWSGTTYDQVSTFTSAQDGEAYYFLNQGGELDQLEIPFFPSPSSAPASKQQENVRVLTLTSVQDEEPTSSVSLGLRPEAKEGQDQFDHFAPPSYFESARLSIDNDAVQSQYLLANDVRPADGEGQTYSVTLETKPGTALELKASGLGQFSPDEQIRLYDPTQAKSYDLRLTSSVEVTPESETTEFTVLIGTESYVKNHQSDLVPETVKLQGNYPNPFRQQTTLEYALPEKRDVQIEVYDLLGRRIRVLAEGEQTAGTHTVQWDGQNETGRPVASGTYLVRLEAGDQTRSIKMTRVR